MHDPAMLLLHMPTLGCRWRKHRHRLHPHLAGSPVPDNPIRVTITEPRSLGRYLFDPDTPADSSALRFSARMKPPGEELVWEVDGVPVSPPQCYSWHHSTTTQAAG
jgi:hypothetical protein